MTPAQLQRLALRVAKLRGKAKHEHALVLADALDAAGVPEGAPVLTGRFLPRTAIVYDVDAWGNADEGWETNEERFRERVRLRLPEALANVRWYRNKIVQGSPIGRGHGALFTHPVLVEETIRRYARRHLLAPKVRFQVYDANGLYEIHEARTGEPLYAIHVEEDG